MRKAATLVLGIALCAVQPACEAFTGTPVDAPVCNGWRANFPATLGVGERRTVLVEGLVNGQPVECADFDIGPMTWISSNPAVLRVTPGVLEGISPGTARVEITIRSNSTGVVVATITSPDVTVVP